MTRATRRAARHAREIRLAGVAHRAAPYALLTLCGATIPGATAGAWPARPCQDARCAS